MWLNSENFAVDGVYWTSPAWARPKSGVGSAAQTDATDSTTADPLGVFPGYAGKGTLLEAWHWEPSNFNELITGIG